MGRDEPIPEQLLDSSLGTAQVLVSASPMVDSRILAQARKLDTIIEVAGAFPDTIDYDACKARNVEVLSCSPGFQQSVAEMALAMALAGARGLVTEHELFRQGSEHWLNDNANTDFSLHGCNVGFIGYGAIARATHALLKAFNVNVMVHDPWLPAHVAASEAITLCSLDALMKNNRCVFVTASPTRSNYQMVNAQAISLLGDASLLIVLSRAHLVDFEALIDAAKSGRIRVAIDVFPDEPLNKNHRARQVENIILSPHRAAAIHNGRQLIGDMLLHDLTAKFSGSQSRKLQQVPATINELMGVGDADQVGSIAQDRESL